MNDQEALEELREMRNYAKQALSDAAEKYAAEVVAFESAKQALRRAEERYMAHLEMMAAMVTQ